MYTDVQHHINYGKHRRKVDENLIDGRYEKENWFEAFSTAFCYTLRIEMEKQNCEANAVPLMTYLL